MEPLVRSHLLEEAVPPTSSSPTRFWVLFLFAYAESLQGLMWMTYSSVPAASKAFLDAGDSTLNWLLELGPIAFVLVSFVSAAVLDRPGGLRLAMLVSCVLLLLASALRCVPPLFYSAEDRQQHAGALLWWVYVAQFLNAAVAPFFEAAPALLSQTWFPVRERSTATAVARTSNAFGRAIGFFLGPALVHSSVDMAPFLYYHVAAAVLLLIFAVIRYPPQPPTPPSRTAAVFGAGAYKAVVDDEASDDNNTGSDHNNNSTQNSPPPPSLSASAARLLSQAKRLLCGDRSASRDGGTPSTAGRWSFLGLVLAFGLQMGAYGSWSGTLTTVLNASSSSSSSSGGGGGGGGGGNYSNSSNNSLSPQFLPLAAAVAAPSFTSQQAGWVGFANTIANIVGGIAMGLAVGSSAKLARRLRRSMVGLCVASGAAFLALALALPPVDVYSLSFGGVLAMSSLAGLFRGGIDPLFFEVSAELSFVVRAPAGTAGTLLTATLHLVMIVLLTIGSVASKTFSDIMPLAMPCAMLSCAAILLFGLTEQYERTALDSNANGR